MWNLEKKCSKWSYLQSRNRDTDVENKCTDTKGEKGLEWIEIGIYTLLIVYIKWEPAVQHRGLYLMLCGDLNGKEIQKREDICKNIADSPCCAAGAHTTL